MTVEAAENPKVKQRDVPPVEERSPVACETDLSKNQTTKKEEVCTAPLPPMTIMDSSNPARPALTDAAVATATNEARDALNPGFLGSKKPEVLKDILGPMNASDMQRFERAYDKPGEAPGQFRRELREKLPADQFREIEALLDRRDGKANVIGTIATSLEVARTGRGLPTENQERAGSMLRAAVGTLNSTELAQMKKDWDTRYGKEYGTFDQAVANSNLSDRDKALMTGIYSKGVEQRTAQDIQDAAKLIINSYNQEYTSESKGQVLRQLADVLGGDNPQAIAARRALREDPEFVKNYQNAFENSWGASKTEVKVAKDLLQEGRISLSTIIEGDTQTLGRFFENPENISSALMRATPRERQQYIDGQKLVADKVDPSKLTPAQRESVDFYNKLDATFKDRGDARQQAMWREQLETGEKGLISRLGEHHSKPEWWQVFSGESNNMQRMGSTIENMDSKDWDRIARKPGQPDTEYMRKLKESIATYASGPEQQRLFKLLDDKATAPSFEASKKVQRSLAEVAADNAAPSAEGRTAILNRLSTMTAADAQELKNNPELRKQTDAAIGQVSGDDPQDAARAVLAQAMVKQMAETGQLNGNLPPEAQFAKDVLDGKFDTPAKRMAAAEKLMLENPELRARLGSLREQDNVNTMLVGAAGRGWQNLLRGEQIPIMLRAQVEAESGTLNSWFKGQYGHIAGLPESERTRLGEMLSPEQKKILDNVVRQNGKTDLADDVQSYLVGDGGSYKDFMQRLGQMNDQQRNEFYANFKNKYGTDFKDAFLKGAASRDGLDEANQKVLANVVKQDFKPTLADELRAFTLDGKGSYKDFEARLASLDFAQRQKLKSEFDSKYGVNLDAAFLPKVEAGDKQKYNNLLTAAETDPLSDYLNRVTNFDNTGVTPDGTRENVERSLQLNREMLTQYSAAREKLPPNVRQALDNYYAEAVKQNLDSRDKAARAAEVAIEVTVLAAALASAPFTGGTSLGALSLTEAGALITSASLATGTVRMGLISSIRGEGRMTDSDKFDQFKAGMIDGMILASPLLFGRTAATAERAPIVRAEFTAGKEIVPVVPGRVVQAETTVGREVVQAEVTAGKEVAQVVPRPVVQAEATAGREVVGAEVTAGREVAVRPVEVKKPVVPEVADDAAGFRVTENGRELNISSVDTPAQRLAAQREEALRRATAEREALAQREALVAERAAAERVAAERAAAERAAAERAAAEKAAAEKAAAERAAAERAAAERAAAERAATERAAAERAAAERAAAERAAAERAAAERTAAERAAAEKAAAEKAAAERAAAERLAMERAATVERPAVARITADAARGLGIPEVAIAAAAGRVVDRVVTPDVQAAEPVAAATAYKPSAKVAELASVRRGEGPWQTAERILASDGQRHGVDEVRALTRAIQAAYKADNNSTDMSGLKVKYNFATKSEQTFNNIINNCQDAKVRALLISLAEKG